MSATPDQDNPCITERETPHGYWWRYAHSADEPADTCSGLRSSALRPEIIAVFWPTIGETVGSPKPILHETEPTLFATDLQSSGRAHMDETDDVIWA